MGCRVPGGTYLFAGSLASGALAGRLLCPGHGVLSGVWGGVAVLFVFCNAGSIDWFVVFLLLVPSFNCTINCGMILQSTVGLFCSQRYASHWKGSFRTAFYLGWCSERRVARCTIYWFHRAWHLSFFVHFFSLSVLEYRKALTPTLWAKAWIIK